MHLLKLHICRIRKNLLPPMEIWDLLSCSSISWNSSIQPKIWQLITLYLF